MGTYTLIKESKLKLLNKEEFMKRTEQWDDWLYNFLFEFYETKFYGYITPKEQVVLDALGKDEIVKGSFIFEAEPDEIFKGTFSKKGFKIKKGKIIYKFKR